MDIVRAQNQSAHIMEVVDGIIYDQTWFWVRDIERRHAELDESAKGQGWNSFPFYKEY